MATHPNPNHHIVIAALGGKTNRALIGHTAVSAPLEWTAAQDLWTKLEHERRAGVWTTGGGTRHPGHVLHYAVRSVSDPRWGRLVGLGYADARGKDGYPSQYGDRGRVKAAKVWAKAFGYQGSPGGWIRDASGDLVTQGWDSFALMLERQGKIAQGSDDLFYVIDRELVP